jgi:GT2 family glycosyltransferase
MVKASNMSRVSSQAVKDTKQSAELSIIIVNCNSTAYLRKCLTSLRRNVSKAAVEIIVVDNASTRDDPGHVLAEFPEARLIRAKMNLGFARANNLGCDSSQGAYLLFLNPDTKILGNAIETMLDHLRILPDAGIVGCKLFNADGSVQTSCIQRFPTVLNQALNIEWLRQRWPRCRLWDIAPLCSDQSQAVPVQVISGACLMITREVFEKVGKFCEDYFMYGEDADLCYRVGKAGLKVYYVPDASVVHIGGGSSKESGRNQEADVMQRRAILRFCRRTRGPVYALAYRIVIGLVAALRLGIYPVLMLFRGRRFRVEIVRSDPDRWFAILKWAMGLDSGPAKQSQTS